MKPRFSIVVFLWMLSAGTSFAQVQPEWIFGIHDPSGEGEIEVKGKRGWIVFTEAIGYNPNDQGGRDYQPWSSRGHGVIVRLNNGYGGAGNLPYESHYPDFAVRVANYIQNSPGADIWILGNETNLPREWPGNVNGDPATGEAITVSRYVNCYNQVWNELERRGLTNEILVPAASGTYGPPLDGTLGHLPNRGVPGFKDYWVQVLNALGSSKVGGLALHAYTHGSDPALVFNDQKMGWPYQDIYYHFRVYRNYMDAIPASMRTKPVWITETDQARENSGYNWDPNSTGWVQNAFAEIDNWNANGANQKIRALVLFRWHDAWEGDKNYCIPCVPQVVDDFREALNHDYKWTDSPPPPSPGCPTADFDTPDDGWKLEIWANRAFSGEVVERRRDATGSGGFTFNWGTGGPSSCTGNDNFALRFSRRAYLPTSGDYRFTTTTDDGVRLWVDGQQVIDRWIDQAPTSHTVTFYLAAGWHDLRMDYYENGGGAYAALGWERLGAVGNQADIRRDLSTVPSSIIAGESAQVRLHVTNTGGTTWSAGQAYRLGSLATNQLTWEAFPCGGYSPSPDNSRAYLCHDVGPNETYEFRFDVRAPQGASGPIRLAARMVRDGVEWFGDSETWDISASGCSMADFAAPDDAWKLEIWANRTLSGEPVERRRDAVGSGGFSFDWGTGGPSGCTGNDNFALRFSRRAFFPSSGDYEFTTTTDDGVRLWVDGVQIIDRWVDQAPTSHRGTRYLTAGWHELRMDYYENGGGAVAALSWEQVSSCVSAVPSDHWKGEYFSNRDLSGNPAMVRDDGIGVIAFNWGGGSPSSECGLPTDDFSVKWTRSVALSAGDYRFTITSDDGFRLYVDGVSRLERWLDQAPTTYTVDVPLSAGTHALRLDYYEHGGGAYAALAWERTGAGLPDVIVESLSISPSSPLPGDGVTFTAVVKNIGSIPTPGDQVIGVGYSIIEGGSLVKHTWGVVSGPLAAGATVSVGTSPSPGPWTATAGTFTISAHVDDVDRFEELDEDNNVSSTTLTVSDGTQEPVASKIGFHVGPGGNQTGLGDWMRALDAAGIPFFLKSADSAGQIYEAARLREVSGVPHVLVYRKSGASEDVPNYDLTPLQAAEAHWELHRSAFPPELEPYKQWIWLETINEVDKNRSEWLAEFAYHTSLLAMNDGFNWAAFGWSSGEPEPEHWEGPQMLNFLNLAGQHPDRIAVALHEYSFTTEDLESAYPHMIGRFQALFDVTDRHGFERPTIVITEFGWSYNDVPGPEAAINHIGWADELYGHHPQILGAAIWYLGPGFGGISDKAQRLIAPLTEYALQKGGGTN